MKLTKIKRVLVLVICGLAFFGVIKNGLATGVYAASMKTPAYANTQKKGYLQGLYRCYKREIITKKFDSLVDYTGAYSLIGGKDANGVVRLVTGFKDSGSNIIEYNELSCKAAMETRSGRPSFFTLFGKPQPQLTKSSENAEAKKTFLTNMGYEVSSAGGGSGDTCEKLEYSTYVGGIKKTGYITNEVCSDGKKLYIGAAGTGNANFSVSNNKAYLSFSNTRLGGASDTIDPAKFSGDDLKATVKKICGSSMQCEASNLANDSSAHGNEGKIVYAFGGSPVNSESSSNYSAKWTNYKTAALKAISYLTDGKYGSSFATIQIPDLEKRLLYQYYLTGIYNVDVQCGDNLKKNDFTGSIAWFDTSSKSMKSCYYDDVNVKHKSKKVNAVNDEKVLWGTIDGYNKMKSEFSKLRKSYSKEEIDYVIDNVVAGGTDTTTATDDNGESNDNDKCYENSGALGWILCPLISKVRDALGTVYDSMVEPFLVIEPELLQGDGVYIAWDIFRNFANIVFVILFLVVIFSQLTGTGIDNYGIKRMLPKLIVAAVLINLSYLICQLAVDISNILGNSLNALFINIAGQVNANATSPTSFFSSTVDTVGTVLGIGVGTGAAFVMFSSAIASGFALIIPILAAFISAIIAVLFMFAILFVRKAIVILLVAVAPVAFVAYIMPNTKRLVFDKWLNIFKGALLLYPLAGALIGGGLLASAIIVSALGTSAESGNAGLQEFFMYIGALLIQVVPFFFLPMLFRRSLAALGNVGERLGRMGTQLGAGASRRFRENEGMQALQTSLAAGREGGLRQRIASHRGMRYLGGNGMARNRMRYQKLRSDEGSLGAMFGEDYMLGTETSNIMKELEASGDINDSGLLRERLQEALTASNSHTTEGRAKIRAYTDALSAKGDSGRKAVREAYNKAVETGGVGNVAAKTFADNIMANHAVDYKNNTRSMFEIAKNINEGGVDKASSNAVTTSAFLGGTMKDGTSGRDYLAGKVTATTIGNMDNDEFADVFRDGIVPSRADVEQVAAAAYAALNDQNANIKVERRAALNKIVDEAKASGKFTPPAQDVHVV